jgi:AraC-like DNA-binding protein
MRSWRLLGLPRTSYREFFGEYQRQHAEILLQDDTLTIAEVGYRLGYSDPGNFIRETSDVENP